MKIVTHSGNFHIDDVFAVAVLLLKFPQAEVLRSRDKEIIDGADIVVDVGKVYSPDHLRFDHHQPEGAGKHPEGVPYASFGLVWKEFGADLAGLEEAELIRKRMVLFIDAIDNGITVSRPLVEGVREYTLHDFLHSFIEEDNSTEEYLYTVFMNVVSIAKEILAREISFAKKKVPGLHKVREILSTSTDRRIIILDEVLPWQEILTPEADVLYVIYPRKEGNWGAKAVPKKLDNFEVKKPFPAEWAGKEGEELIKLTGVEDAVFAHHARHLVGARSKEGAFKLARAALSSYVGEVKV